MKNLFKKMAFDGANLDGYLMDYYRFLYPVDLITKWLLYGKSKILSINLFLDSFEYFSFREFAFILKDDVHLRYLSFDNSSEFLEKLHKTYPYKIDIGPIYNRQVIY